MLDKLADSILSITTNHPTRVGINGVDGSGKTMLAAELMKLLESKTKRQVILASIDDFHSPKAIRYQKGRRSPEGFFRDSYDFDGLRKLLLEPLGPDGSLEYRTKQFDLASDRPMNQPPRRAANDAILILEGIFLFRPQLMDSFEYKIFLDVPFAVVLERMKVRDHKLLESQSELTDLFNERYMPGQKLYLAESNPRARADIVINNSDFNHPIIQ